VLKIGLQRATAAWLVAFLQAITQHVQPFQLALVNR
jgi:hypothetical protein